MENLTLKETMAIELRYLGNTLEQIAEKTDTPFGTLQGWFKTGGKLFENYLQYSKDMNTKRRESIEEKFSATDEEMFILGTNIVRKLAQGIQGKEVPLLNKKGELVYDKDDKPIMIKEELSVSVADFERVWKMQRIMKGLPVNVERQDISTEIKVNSDEVIKALGLVEEDFKEENYGETLKRINKYLSTRSS